MIGAIFKIAGMIINTGTNIVASGAVITSTALIKGQETAKKKSKSKKK